MANSDIPVSSLVGGTTYYVRIIGSPDPVLLPGNYLMTLTIGSTTSNLGNIRRITNAVVDATPLVIRLMLLKWA